MGFFIQESPDSDLNCGVFRLHHVGGNPISNIDPSGTCVGPLALACAYAIIYAEEIATATIIGAEIASGVPNPTSSVASFPGRAAQALTHDVYLGMKNGEPVYVGITKNLASRACAHGDRFDYLKKLTDTKVTKDQARAIEQVLKNENPHFENIINSIAPTRSWHNPAYQYGREWLSGLEK